MMTMDRLSPLDASFLHIEDEVSHMHIASVAIFEGPAARLRRRWSAWSGASCRSCPATARWSGRFRWTWADRCGWTTRISTSTTTFATPPCPPRAARTSCAGWSGRVMAQQLDRTKPLWEIWMVEGLEDGQLGHRCPRPTTPWSTACRAPTCWRSSWTPRPMPSTPEPDDWVPRAGTRRRSSWPRQAVVDMARSPYEQFRALRAGPGSPRQAARQLGRGRPRACPTMAGLVRPTPLSSLNGPIGPHRRYAWASTTVDDIKTGPQGPGRHLQRRRPGCDHRRLPRAAAVPGRVGRPGGPHPGAGIGPAPGRERQGHRRRHATRTRSRPCSPSCPWASPTPSSGCTRSGPRWPG